MCMDAGDKRQEQYRRFTSLKAPSNYLAATSSASNRKERREWNKTCTEKVSYFPRLNRHNLGNSSELHGMGWVNIFPVQLGRRTAKYLTPNGCKCMAKCVGSFSCGTCKCDGQTGWNWVLEGLRALTLQSNLTLLKSWEIPRKIWLDSSYRTLESIIYNMQSWTPLRLGCKCQCHSVSDQVCLLRHTVFTGDICMVHKVPEWAYVNSARHVSGKNVYTTLVFRVRLYLNQ